jgi:hypothetical protein
MLAVDSSIASAAHATGTVNGSSVDTEKRSHVAATQLEVTVIGAATIALRLEDSADNAVFANLSPAPPIINLANGATVASITTNGKFAVRSQGAHRRYVRASITVTSGPATAAAQVVRTLAFETPTDIR